jgi:hypothetical protein
MEYDTKNPRITTTETQFFMPSGPLKISEGSKSFEHDFRERYTVYNILAHAVLVPSVLSDPSGCYQEMSSFHNFLLLHQFSLACNEEIFKTYV